jgi:outer membrane protein assembly complex protein YaeT
LLAAIPLHGQSNLKVRGLGFLKDRNLQSRLAFLHDVEPKKAAKLDAALLEDSAFLLLEQMKRRGYEQPVIEGRFRVGETIESFQWENPYAIQLDVDFRADHAEFIIEPGVLSYYSSVTVEGIEEIVALETKKVERFFIPGGVLFSGKQSRIFTMENLDRRVGRLLRALDDLGYRAARVVDQQVDADESSGAVAVRLVVEPGRLHKVGEVTVEIDREGRADAREVRLPENVILTRDWEQAQRVELRNAAYRAGYPDARLFSEVVSDVEAEGNVMRRNLRFRVEYGEKVQLAGVEFRGDPDTERSVLKRQAKLKSGEVLDLIGVNAAQRKLMGLGIFQEVGLRFEPANGERRTAVYELTPSQRKELQLRAGWGSYEQARLGFRWEHRNPWGRAHRYEVEVKQSLKSTLGDVTYSVPQIFGTDLSAYLNADYSSREELSFDRTARSVAAGTSLQFAESGLRLSTEYRLSKETADRDNTSVFQSQENATVASVILRAAIDRRNDFLAPSSGYSLFASFKVASELLGGNVDFQKLEFGGSYHFAISESTLVHIGLRGGTIVSSADAATNIPFNERFFLGGENSVRGYVEGGAAPLDANRDEIGAESYILGNLEIEQRLFRQFSLVAFVDGVANSPSGTLGSDSEGLYSAGMGLRYTTPVGPLRLEYGHNLNPRDSDPDGTLHFSIGFPF